MTPDNRMSNSPDCSVASPGAHERGISTEAVEMQVAMTVPAPKRKSRARIRPGKKKDQTFRGNSPEAWEETTEHACSDLILGLFRRRHFQKLSDRQNILFGGGAAGWCRSVPSSAACACVRTSLPWRIEGDVSAIVADTWISNGDRPAIYADAALIPRSLRVGSYAPLVPIKIVCKSTAATAEAEPALAAAVTAAFESEQRVVAENQANVRFESRTF